MIVKKIKVMHVISKLDTGGLENGVINVSNSIDRSVFEPSVCCLHEFGSMIERLKKDVKIFNLGLKEGNPILRILPLVLFLRKESPDVVHAHAWGQGSFEVVLSARLAGIKVVINGEHGAFFLSKTQIYFQRFIAGLCDITLSVSDSLKIKIVEHLNIPSHRIQVIPNGVDLELFNGKRSVMKIKKELLTAVGLDFTDAFVISIIGSLKKEKNQILMLRVMLQVLETCSSCKLILLLIGSGSDRSTLENFVQSNGLAKNVFFLGNRDDIPELLSLTNLVVSTSLAYWEGMSNVMLEAMASGVPVVATKSVGAAELIRDGYNGFLIEQNDSNGLRTALELLINNRQLLATMGNNSRNFVVEGYSLNRMNLAYQKLYLELFKR